MLATVRVSCRRGAALTLALSSPAEALFISSGAAGAVLRIAPSGASSQHHQAQRGHRPGDAGQLTVRASGSGRHLGDCTAAALHRHLLKLLAGHPACERAQQRAEQSTARPAQFVSVGG